MEFDKPTIEYFELLPILLIFGTACLGIVLEAFAPRSWRYRCQVALTVSGLVAAIVATGFVAADLPEVADGAARGIVAAEGAIAVDGPSVFLWLTILVLSLTGVVLFAERKVDSGVTAFASQAAALPGSDAERESALRRLEQSEVFPLMMFATGGMLLFPAANDLLTMFVALEIMSLPLYLLCGLARRRRLLSQEAALKYFLLGAFTSAFFLYGAALLYGYAGSFELAAIADAVENRIGSTGLLLGGIALVSVGLLFKVGAAPFHAWTPDVYQGAPTPVTAFMAACTKVAAFGALLRLFYVALEPAQVDWSPLMWVAAALTMVVGGLLALTQSDVKRMLAYSSVAHAGFLLTGFVGLHASDSAREISSIQAVLFYLVTYGFMVVAAFAIVMLVRDDNGEVTALERWAGLGRQSPITAGVFAFLLLGMAGIPLTSGFTGKWAVFAAAAQGGAWPLVVAGVLVSAVAAFFYIRVIVLMFFSEPVSAGPTVAVPSTATTIVIGVGFLVTVLLGVVPGSLLNLAGDAGQFIR